MGDEDNRTRKRPFIYKPMTLENGKLPPQAVDLEEVVIGALLLEKDAISEVSDIITEDSFYKESNQKIYAAILQVNQRSEPIDILTVTHQLKNNGTLDMIGGAYAITQLTNRVSSAANIETHARIVEEKKIARDIIKSCSDMITEAYDETHDIFKLTEKMVTDAYEIGNIHKGTIGLSNTELLRKVKEGIENAKKFQGITGLRSGLMSQDIEFGGYKPGNLYIKAGRPAMGKTGLALSEANYMANVEHKNVLFFSIEMSEEQLMERLTSIHTEISLNKYKSGEFSESDWKHYNEKTSEMMNDNLKIIDKPAISLNEVRRISKKHKLKYGLHCIYVDYLQLMTDKIKGEKSREQEVSRISVGLKSLSKELKIPIIALAQLSRAVEQRGGEKIPQLSDLRESGSIEQDADAVQFLYRPEYYGITEDENGNSTTGRAELYNAKNRHGSVGTIYVKFIDYLTKFKDISSEDEFNNFDNSTMPTSTEFNHVPTSSQDRKENFFDNDSDDDSPF
ncbi:replicative DNA helicase [bacterium]|nr:replicative DNA helicase [bacterium]